jgi:hypothetical protein
MNADGTGQHDVTTGESPGWSPDGTKLVFSRDCLCPYNTDGDIYTIRVDGSDETNITNNSNMPEELYPDWQPINPAPYPTPVGASPLRVSLVPAFKPCETGSANSQHGPPLDFPSCSNPALASSTVTLGSNLIGFARMVVCSLNAAAPFCNPTPTGVMPKPDVRFTGSIRDVRCRQTSTPPGCIAGSDYNPNSPFGPYVSAGNGTGAATPPCYPTATSSSDCVANADLTASAFLESPASTTGGTGAFAGHGVRITDSFNGRSQNDSATVTDMAFPIPLDCIATGTAFQGSTCGVNTTANALAPGVVTAGDTAVWQIGQVELKDSGPDGVRGNSDDERFATQGIFLP